MIDNIGVKKLKIVFFGTPKFSVKILETMDKSGFTPSLVITAPDKPKGRKMTISPSPVKIWAQEKNIPVSHDYKNPEEADLFVVASFGKILPKEILEIPKHGILNVHPSLLPKLRGPSPIQTAILEGEKKTGVTIMLLNEKMDEGPVLATQELEFLTLPAGRQVSNSRPHCQRSVAGAVEFRKLENELAKLGGKLLVKTIPEWIAGKIKPISQDHDKATYTKIITKKDGEIDWNESPETIERKIRALNPWPSTYTFFNPARGGAGGKRIIVSKASLDEKGALKIERVKPEGKNEIDFQEFLKNNPSFPYPILKS